MQQVRGKVLIAFVPGAATLSILPLIPHPPVPLQGLPVLTTACKKHSFHCKFLPEEELRSEKKMSLSLFDVLWSLILI